MLAYTQEIRWTKNYARFTLPNEGKNIYPHQLEQLRMSMSNQGWIKDLPMTVNQDMLILDGRHRFIIARELGIAIPYVIEEIDLPAIEEPVITDEDSDTDDTETTAEESDGIPNIDFTRPVKMGWTRDYDLFKLRHSNREIKPRILKKARAGLLKKGYWDETQPMIINSEFEIIDGQHRFVNAKEMGLEIPVIVNDHFEPNDIARYNSERVNWTREDYIGHYAKEGDKDFQLVDDFCKRWKVGTTEGIAMLTGKIAGAAISNSIKDGTIEVSKLMLRQGEKLAGQIKEVYQNINIKRETRLTNALVMIMNHPRYSHTRMIKKLKLAGDKLTKSTHTIRYVQKFQDVYNYNIRRGDKVNFVED